MAASSIASWNAVYSSLQDPEQNYFRQHVLVNESFFCDTLILGRIYILYI